VSARGAIPSLAALRRVELRHLDELGLFDPLHDQLRDPVAARQHDRFTKIMVDQADADLTPVPGVDGARCVHHRKTDAGGEAGPRVHEPRVPGWQRDRDPRPDHTAFPRSEHDIGGRHEVGAGITGTGVGRKRDRRVDSGKQDLNGGHGRRDYPERVSESANAAEGGTVKHSERLYVPWWGWPLPLLGGALLAAEIDMGYPGIRAWLPYVILIPAVLALMFSLGRSKVEITGGAESELWLRDAHLPLRFAGDVEVIGKEAKRTALGRDADPAGFVLHRGWVGPMVRVWLTDPDDPTPYWMFSTRHPQKVAELLRQSAHNGAENS